MKIGNIQLLGITYIVLVVFHVAVFWNQSTADVVPDEISYLTQARYFAGESQHPDTLQFLLTESYLAGKGEIPDTEGWPYYHFGYSLLVSPAYWFSDSPADAYRGVILINSLMLSSLCIIIFFWLRELDNIDSGTAIIISAITSVYPAYIFYTHIGWAENAFIPAFALSVLLYTKFLKVGKPYLLMLFSVTVGFLYAIHPRGLAISISGIICLLLIFLSAKEKRVFPIIGIVVISGILISSKLIASELSVIMNTVQHGGGIISKFSSLLDLKIMPALLGQILYLSLSTIGLYILACVYMVREISNYNETGFCKLIYGVSSGTFIYVLLSALILLAVSVLFFAESIGFDKLNPSIDKYIYGRYNEGLLSVFLALGLLYLYKMCVFEPKSAHYSKSLKTGFFIFGIIAIVYSGYIADLRGLRAIHASGLYPWYFLTLNLEGWFSVAIIFVAPLLWTWIILQLSFQNIFKGFLAIAAYFILISLSLIVYVTPGLRVLN